MNHSRMGQKRFFQSCSRREVLKVLSAVPAAMLFGCDRGRSIPNADNLTSSAATAGFPACVARPEQTEGPYFVDEKLHRSDIRVEPTDKSLKPGAPLRLEFHASRIAGGSCNPLVDAIVDVWHCDALGVYSDVRDRSFDTRGKKFLRGYQTTEAQGIARFLTIYPGWYEGRAVHIHFKIRTEDAARHRVEFTSQLYFDESITDQIYNSVPYNSKGRRTTTNDSDFIFRRGGKQLIPMLTKDAQGYTAKFDIGLQIG